MKDFKKIIIAALSNSGVISLKGKMPWDIPEELKHFKKCTEGYPVIMGRKTFEAIENPLINRFNIILSGKKKSNSSDVLFVDSLEKALSIAREKADKTFIIGGGSVFRQAIGSVDELILSFVNGEFNGDVFFPMNKLNEFDVGSEEINEKFIVKHYYRKDD